MHLSWVPRVEPSPRQAPHPSSRLRAGDRVQVGEVMARLGLAGSAEAEWALCPATRGCHLLRGFSFLELVPLQVGSASTGDLTAPQPGGGRGETMGPVPRERARPAVGNAICLRPGPLWQAGSGHRGRRGPRCQALAGLCGGQASRVPGNRSHLDTLRACGALWGLSRLHLEAGGGERSVGAGTPLAVGSGSAGDTFCGGHRCSGRSRQESGR